MICTQQQAREVIAAHYGFDYAQSIRFRKNHGHNVLMRPTYETDLGAITLAWRKLEAGAEATVWIGVTRNFVDVDWNWTEARAALAKAEGR